MSDQDKHLDDFKMKKEDNLNENDEYEEDFNEQKHSNVEFDDEEEEEGEIAKEEDDLLEEQEEENCLNSISKNSLDENQQNQMNSIRQEQLNHPQHDSDESLTNSNEMNNLNEDSKHSLTIANANKDDKDNQDMQDTQKQTSLSQENPEILFKKLEIIKEIKNKTINLQRIKSRLAQEVECIETESKCLINFQNELELLTQEKLAHLEELRQIQNDISTMETTIRQSDDEKKKALEMARHLQIEYRPLKEQINELRESIGLEKIDDNDDVEIIESFLNKLQPFNEIKSNNKSNNRETNEKSLKLNNSGSDIKVKHSQKSMNENNNESSHESFNTTSNKTSTTTNASNNNKQSHKMDANKQNLNIITSQQNLLKSQSMDLPLQLATVALMAHSLRSKSPNQGLPQQLAPSQPLQSSLPFNMFNNQLDPHSVAQENSLKQLNQFILNQNKMLNNGNNNSNNEQASQLQQMPPSFRQQPPPMKSCLSCHQQIHRNAPICPLCKAKSRSRNPKKPKNKDSSSMLNDLSPSSSSSNINLNTKSMNTQKVKQYNDKKNRC